MNKRIRKKVLKRIYSKIDKIEPDYLSERKVLFANKDAFSQLEIRVFLSHEAEFASFMNEIIEELKAEGKW